RQVHGGGAGGGLLEAGQELGNNALPPVAVLPDGAAAMLPLEGDVPVAAAVQQQVAVLLRQVLPRRLEVDAERLRDALVDVAAPAAHVAQRADQRDGPGVETEARVRHQQGGGERGAPAEALAVGAPAGGAVEAERLRARFLVALVAGRAGVVGRQEDVVVLGRAGSVSDRRGPLRSLTLPAHLLLHRDDQRPLRQRQRLLDRLGQARAL